MNEQERATSYQAHKDDRKTWGDAGDRDAPRPQRNLSATVTMRFSHEEANRLRRMAQITDMSYSDIVRQAVRAYTELGPLLGDRNVTQNYSPQPMVNMPQPLIEFGPDFRVGSGSVTLLSADKR